MSKEPMAGQEKRLSADALDKAFASVREKQRRSAELKRKSRLYIEQADDVIVDILEDTMGALQTAVTNSEQLQDVEERLKGLQRRWDMVPETQRKQIEYELSEVKKEK